MLWSLESKRLTVESSRGRQTVDVWRPSLCLERGRREDFPLSVERESEGAAAAAEEQLLVAADVTRLI